MSKKSETAGPEKTDKGRRDFLKMAGVAAPGAVAAAAMGGTAAQADTPAETSGLRDTEHTRAFYASARF